MKFEFEGIITGFNLHDYVTSTVTITNIYSGHAIKLITLEITNKDIAKEIVKTNGVDAPFLITIGGE